MSNASKKVSSAVESAEEFIRQNDVSDDAAKTIRYAAKMMDENEIDPTEMIRGVDALRKMAGEDDDPEVANAFRDYEINRLETAINQTVKKSEGLMDAVTKMDNPEDLLMAMFAGLDFTNDAIVNGVSLTSKEFVENMSTGAIAGAAFALRAALSESNFLSVRNAYMEGFSKEVRNTLETDRKNLALVKGEAPGKGESTH